MISTSIYHDPDDVGSTDACALAHFLNGGASGAQHMIAESCASLERLHSEFHEAAAEVAMMINIRRLEEAMYLMSTDFRYALDQLLQAITELDRALQQRAAAA